jgi:hypothetical protein
MKNFFSKIKEIVLDKRLKENQVDKKTNIPQVILNEIEKNILYFNFSHPGHYYSPIPDVEELRAHQEQIFRREKQSLDGIEINDKLMLEYLSYFAPYFSDFPFQEKKTSKFRFWLDNGVYPRGDAVVLYSMMRHLKPSRIIEVGSGMSSCLMLDTNERFFDNSIQLTFIDPYPERLLSTTWDNDLKKNNKLLPIKLQSLDLGMFAELEQNDIIFFDSSHVSKCNSDVNFIFFNILPILKPGVFIHFHDIFYPFEYPKEWLLEIGVAWNEAYLLRAFLEYNSKFNIEFFSDYMGLFHQEKIVKTIPLFMQRGGSSIWLKKS